MLKPDMIPDEVVEAALEAYAHASGLGIIPYDDEDWHEDLVNGMRASISAALQAWPGVFLYPMNKTRHLPPPSHGEHH